MKDTADWLRDNTAMLQESAGTPTGSPARAAGRYKPSPQEVLQWQRLDDGLPDDDITILAAWEDGTVEAVFRDGDAWRLCHSGDAAAEAPTWWAEWPAGPTC